LLHHIGLTLFHWRRIFVWSMHLKPSKYISPRPVSLEITVYFILFVVYLTTLPAHSEVARAWKEAVTVPFDFNSWTEEQGLRKTTKALPISEHRFEIWNSWLRSKISAHSVTICGAFVTEFDLLRHIHALSFLI
jgi:hypothetical protein